MAGRPQDYGDPFPSDIGDIPPASPVSGFGETNFRLSDTNRVTARAGKMRELPGQAEPDLGVRKDEKPPRITYTGLVIKQGFAPGEWEVLRQDGKRGIAYIRASDGVYDQLRPGEHVTMCLGQLGKNQWLITGAPRRNELSTIEITNSLEQGPSNTLIRINMDELVSETSMADGFSQLGGGFRADKAKVGLYAIHWSVTAVCVNPDPFTTSVVAEGKCEQLSELTTKRDKVVGESTIYNRDSGLFLSRYVEADGAVKAMVSLKVRTPYLMPTSGVPSDPDVSDDVNEGVTWTDSPILGGNLTVGKTAPQGWLKITNVAGSYLWLGHGNTKSKIRFPNSQAVVGSHLVVSGTHEDAYEQCVQLKWSSRGLTGVFTVYDCDCLPTYLSVRDGLIVGVTGSRLHDTLSNIATNVPVNCQDNTPRIWSCVDDDVLNPGS